MKQVLPVVVGLLLSFGCGTTPGQDVPYEPTPMPVVRAMLELAGVDPQDVVYDLGSGDGRIPIVAASEFGARGVGIEIDPALVTQAQAKAREAGVEDKVEFRVGDMYAADVRPATVVTLFLHPKPNLKLRPKLRAELQAGSRVVSYVWDMADWTPEVARRVNAQRIFLWRIPHRAGHVRDEAVATVGVLTVSAAPAGIGELSAPPMQPQPQTVARTPAFEVASIKPNKSGEPGNVFRLRPDGGFTATNAPLKELIRVAYQLQNFQIAGAPGWIDSARFDIDARPEAGAPASPVDGVAVQMVMLRALLADRFNLRVHNESRELPIYALILARSDGKFGAGLRSTEGGCKALVAERAGGGPPPATDTSSRCGMRRTFGRITGRDIAMTQLANGLAPLVGRLVIDRTGLTENVDLDLSWTPDQSAPGPAGAQTDSSGPSIFTALQEQLGLKLESTRGPVDVLVIDSVEQPTPD